ncbi:MAG TPA: HEAT repeat domain-containing protein [Anaeromyxobacteraceae bacterium]|nr:HEAT repeat domain-containing protein [Anaeromyxobacteraceae bacterium]
MGSGEPGREQGRPPGFLWLLRPLLYGLLLASAAVTLTGVPALEAAVQEGRAPAAVLMLPPSLLAVFILLFAFYRFALVRAGRYHGGKALVQVGFLFAALALLLPGSMERYRAAGAPRQVDLTRQLGSSDPEARAMAAELARHRAPEDALRYVPRLVELMDDPSPEVRRQARASLVALAGRDAGGEGPEASSRWRDWWRGRGVSFPGR